MNVSVQVYDKDRNKAKRKAAKLVYEQLKDEKFDDYTEGLAYLSQRITPNKKPKKSHFKLSEVISNQ